MRKLTEEQKQRYLTDLPACPWCESGNLNLGLLTTHDSTILRCTVECDDCESQWDEIYERKGIEEVESTIKLYEGEEHELIRQD